MGLRLASDANTFADASGLKKNPTALCLVKYSVVFELVCCGLQAKNIGNFRKDAPPKTSAVSHPLV
jgi:hypothetical protein